MKSKAYPVIQLIYKKHIHIYYNNKDVSDSIFTLIL